MKVPMGSNFEYKENGIYFRVYHKSNRIKIYARLGNKTVIEYANTPYEAAEKAIKRLLI